MPLDATTCGQGGAAGGGVSGGGGVGGVTTGAASVVACGGGKQQRALKLAISRMRHHEVEPGGRSAEHTDSELVALPPRLRTRLHDLFSQIEKEFEAVCLENSALHRELELLQEKSELVGRLDDADCAGVKNKQKLMSHKLRTAHKLRQQTSKIVSSFKTPSTHCAMVRQFRGHKDGVWDVHAGRVDSAVLGTASADHTARVWSRDTARCLLVYHGHNGSVNSIRFHPTRELAVTASGDHTAHVWHAAVVHDTATAATTSAAVVAGRAVSSEDEIEGIDSLCDLSSTGFVETNSSSAAAAAACFHDSLGSQTTSTPQQQCAASTSGGGCSNSLRTPLLELKGHAGVVIAADWLLGAEQVVTASWDRCGHVYDIAAGGECVNTLAGHDAELTHVSAHPTQKFVVTASRDSTFRLWDFREPIACVSVFQGHTDTVTSAVFTSEERVVSGSDDRTCRVWDLRNMRAPVATMRGDAAVNRLSVTPPALAGLGAPLVAVPFDNRHIRVYDVAGQRLCRLPRSNRVGHRRMVTGVAWADEWSAARVNLFSCGFDNVAIGWLFVPAKENRD